MRTIVIGLAIQNGPVAFQTHARALAHKNVSALQQRRATLAATTTTAVLGTTVAARHTRVCLPGARTRAVPHSLDAGNCQLTRRATARR